MALRMTIKQNEDLRDDKSPLGGDLEGLIVNKVAQSGLISIDLEEFYPSEERVLFDIKPWLFEELILKEKDFRAALQRRIA